MTPTTNPLIAWIQELFLRLTAKSPKFYKVWQIITGVLVLIVAVPNALQLLNIHLPQIFDKHIQDVVGWAATTMLFMSFLSVQGKTVAVDQNGNAVKQTNPDKLPFTAMQEAKAVIKDIQDEKTPPVDEVVLQSPVTPKV